MSRKLFSLILLVAFLAGLLASCAPAATPTAAPALAAAAPTDTSAPPAPTDTAAPTATTAPTVPAATATTAATPTVKPTIRSADKTRLVLATTTSTQDSGLLEYLLPDFEKEFNIKVDVIAVGTGQALQIGKDGNADVLLVHARAQEDAFMKNNDGTRREDVMYNDFVIVGPASDPAKIKGTAKAADAFKLIAAAQSPFISRGDKSGTNTKELAIWKAAGITPSGSWYVSAGQGMGEVLTMASEQQAYTLSDRATFLARTKKGIDLQILVEKGKDLLNPYGVIAVNPNKGPQINADMATKFIDWIISVPVQEKIKAFGMADFQQSLFIPDSKPWHDKYGGTSVGSPTK
ncbi:MAG TPA: substrate-binding domain-containing protein [Anaerolineaceae bacterium]